MTLRVTLASCPTAALCQRGNLHNQHSQKEFEGAQAPRSLPWCGTASLAQSHRAGSSKGMLLMEPHTDCSVPETFSVPGAPETAPGAVQ